MDRKQFEKDLFELIKKHGFATENVTKVKIEVDLDSVFLVTVGFRV